MPRLFRCQDGCLRCGCTGAFRYRNGRFGLFLFCTRCKKPETLEKAVRRLDEGPVTTLIVELEDLLDPVPGTLFTSTLPPAFLGTLLNCRGNYRVPGMH